MRFRLFAIVVCGIGLLCGFANAQDAGSVPAEPSEPTLPEVVVQAPGQGDTTPTGDGPSSGPTNPFGISQSYPSLREQKFDGL